MNLGGDFRPSRTCSPTVISGDRIEEANHKAIRCSDIAPAGELSHTLYRKMDGAAGMNSKTAEYGMKAKISMAAVLLLAGALAGCFGNEKDPPAKPEISRDALPEGRVITPNNRCGQGFSWCEKQGKCVKPLALLKGRDIHALKKIFEQECGTPK